MFSYQRFVLGRGGPTGVAGVEGDDTAALPGGQVERLLEDWHRAQAGRKDTQMAWSVDPQILGFLNKF